MATSFRDLRVYREAMDVVVETYTVTEGLVSTERYNLQSQARRAAVSIAANIAEGWGRQTVGYQRQFYLIARGSLRELDCLLEAMERLHSPIPDSLKARLIRVERSLSALIRSLDR